jgi:hypothetical protein
MFIQFWILCLLPNLGNYQPLFSAVRFHPLLFLVSLQDYKHMNVKSFALVPETSGALLFFIYLFLVVLGFELRASCSQGQLPMTLATPPAPIFF